MKSKRIIFSILLLFTLFIVNCSSKLDLSLYHLSDDSVDYSKYKTFQYYGWADNSDSVLTFENKNIIEQSFAEEFALRDLTLVKENGDLIVNLIVHTQQVTAREANTYYGGGMGMAGYGGYGGMGMGGYGGYYGYGPGYGWGAGMSSTTVYNTVNYTEGSLIINIFDARKKILIYESIAIKNDQKKYSGKKQIFDLITRSLMYDFKVPVASKKKKKK